MSRRVVVASLAFVLVLHPGCGDDKGQGADAAIVTDAAPDDAVPLPSLFTDGADTVDFNTVAVGSYRDGTQYDSLDGDDQVTLPVDTTAATAAGFSLSMTFGGGGGSDTLIGGLLGDRLDGGDGDDELRGGDGDDLLIGGAGADDLQGGEGDDVLVGDVNEDVIDGGPGNDQLDLVGGFSVSSFANVSNIEIINLENQATDTVSLVDGTFGPALLVYCEIGDTANLVGNWTLVGTISIGGRAYNQYSLASDFFIEQSCAVSIS